MIKSIKVENISIDPKKLKSDEAKRFIDPESVNYKATIEFVSTVPHIEFIISVLIRGLTAQKNVKCLNPDMNTIHYFAVPLGENRPVHGKSIGIYDTIRLMPINQDLPDGFKFELKASNTEDPRYYLTILSSSLTPIKEIPKSITIPFHRRFFLLHLAPGESFEGKFTVGVANNYSLKEMTFFERPNDYTLVFGTTLGRNPKDLMSLIISQIKDDISKSFQSSTQLLGEYKIESEIENLIREYGMEKDEVMKTLLAVFDELLKKKW